MGIQFLLMVNKQGQTRLSQYFFDIGIQERTTLEGELVRKCLGRAPTKSSFLEHQKWKIIYRKYASLYFIIGTDMDDDSEQGYFAFIHNVVETFDKYFESVCELDIMFNIEKAHYILEEMMQNGQIIENNKNIILSPLYALEKAHGSS